MLRRKGKKLDRGDERMETFLCWIFIVGKALTVSNVMRSKLNLRSDFVPKKFQPRVYVHAVNCKNLDWHEFLSLLGGKGMLEQQPQISLVIHWHVLARLLCYSPLSKQISRVPLCWLNLEFPSWWLGFCASALWSNEKAPSSPTLTL